MLKSVVLLCGVLFVVIEARPKWQYLPEVPGYVPVYIRPGDTPLEEINPDLAEAFHALPAGRSAGKIIDASPEEPEQADQPQEEPVEEPKEQEKIKEEPIKETKEQEKIKEEPIEETKEQEKEPKEDAPELSAVDHRPYEKKVQKKKASEITKPVERR